MLRKLVLLLTNVVLGAALVAGVATPASAAPVEAAVVTLTYDDTYAAEFKDAVAEGVRIWNESVSSVRIVKASPGRRANIRVYADYGWPRATLGPVRPYGQGTVYMGRRAVNDGHNAIRIASHEFGHILGLPDRRTGLCSDLMSGSSAGTSCTNPYPNSAETARVQRAYGYYSAGFDDLDTGGLRPLVVDAG